MTMWLHCSTSPQTSLCLSSGRMVSRGRCLVFAFNPGIAAPLRYGNIIMLLHSAFFLSYCLVCGPFVFYLFLNYFFPQITLVVFLPFLPVWPHSFLFLSFTASQRYIIVREPIFISVFLFCTQIQVKKGFFHFFSIFSFFWSCSFSKMFSTINPSSTVFSSPRSPSFINQKCILCCSKISRVCSSKIFWWSCHLLLCHWTLLFSLCVIVLFGDSWCWSWVLQQWVYPAWVWCFLMSPQKYMPTATANVCHLFRHIHI